MIKRQNDRLLHILIIGVAALIIIAAVLLISDCGKDEEGWLGSSGEMMGTVSGSDSGKENAALEGVFAAPEFKDGSYTMVSAAVTQEDYTDGTGQVIYTFSSTTRYTYQLDIKRQKSGIICTYTFKNIYGASGENGETAVQIDTADPDKYSEELSMFYDLLGKSFIITADSRGNITGITGVEELLAACPDSASLIDRELLLNMAADLFYEIPATFDADTEWSRNQFESANTYTLKNLKNGRFGIEIAGAQAALPDPFTDASGYTTAYTSVSPLTGSLWIDQYDRALQELSTYQRSSGTFADQNGYGTYFTVTSSTNCTITAQK